MDRRQRKLQDKKKKRELAKKRARLEAERRPSDEQLLARAGARAPFGPCFVSLGWDDSSTPHLVSVVLTRALGPDELLPHVLLLDRTCLGIKNAMLLAPMSEAELDELVERVGIPHGGMDDCDALLAQSLAFHALEYAAKLGFPPNADFHESLIGPRPADLLATPWASAERPIYLPGPDDNVGAILAQLEKVAGTSYEVGPVNADRGLAGVPDSDDDEDEDEDED